MRYYSDYKWLCGEKTLTPNAAAHQLKRRVEYLETEIERRYQDNLPYKFFLNELKALHTALECMMDADEEDSFTQSQ